MGKKSSAPPAPNYTQAAQQTASGNLVNARVGTNTNRWNEVGPDGSVSWSIRPGGDGTNPGDYVRTTELSGPQQALRQQSDYLGDRFGDFVDDGLTQFRDDDFARQQLADSLYRRNTQYYDRRFDRDQNALETKLINSGLARGSEAFDEALQTFGENKNTAYADASDRAVIGAETQSRANQESAWNRLMAALDAQRGGMRAPPQSSNTGAMPMVGATDYLSAQGQQYEDALQQTNADNARRAAPWNALTGLASAYLIGRRG